MRETNLPEGYSEIRKIDLKANKREALLVNGLALIIATIMILVANVFVPLSGLIMEIARNEKGEFFIFILVIPALILYVLAHEAVHGFFMKKYSGIKPKYGFTGLYAYAGSEAYFNKKHYLIIALSPVVILGLILAILNIFGSIDWFWFIFYIQITNISGAAGDLYVSLITRRLPDDILIQDIGVSMTVYSKII